MAPDPNKIKQVKDVGRPGVLFSLARQADSSRLFVGSSDGKVYDIWVWTPETMLYNQRSIEMRLPTFVAVTPTGSVKYRQRVYGTFSAPLDLHEFPMDRQTLPITVVSLNYGRGGKDVPWKYRDHGHFIAFAPYDNPRYACAVAIEHGAGSSSAYPVARDVMTYIFDPQKALDVLNRYEEEWGGTAQERLARKYASYEEAYGGSAPKPKKSEIEDAVSGGEASDAPAPVNAAQSQRAAEGDAAAGNGGGAGQ